MPPVVERHFLLPGRLGHVHGHNRDGRVRRHLSSREEGQGGEFRRLVSSAMCWRAIGSAAPTAAARAAQPRWPLQRAGAMITVPWTFWRTLMAADERLGAAGGREGCVA